MNVASTSAMRRFDFGGTDLALADYYRWREAFADGLCKVENVIVSQCGEWATVEFRNTGTHTGVLRSSLGDFPPTDKTSRSPLLLGDAGQGRDGC